MVIYAPEQPDGTGIAEAHGLPGHKSSQQKGGNHHDEPPFELSDRGPDAHRNVTRGLFTDRFAIRASRASKRLDFGVKLALAVERGVKASEINVDTDHGTVTLYGEVGSQAERQLAVKVAQDVSGVKTIVNKIHVRS